MSMQMQRLEYLLGQKLFRRTGRGVIPSAEGEVFLGYATRILALGDEAVARLNEPPLDGAIYLGLPEEVALASLPAVLGRFRRAHPGVRLDVLVDNTAVIEPLWQEGKLDVIVATPSAVSSDALATWSVGLRWVCGLDYEPNRNAPLDLVVFADPCTWRRRMFEVLAEAGLNHRTAFTSPSVAAVQAAVENGLGIALLNPECIRPTSMQLVPSSLGLLDPLIVQYGLYGHLDRNTAINTVIDDLLDDLTGKTFQDDRIAKHLILTPQAGITV
jgi:DNA-binding transcriptional LysR family regulator